VMCTRTRSLWPVLLGGRLREYFGGVHEFL
jgi:hypothetical protein